MLILSPEREVMPGEPDINLAINGLFSGAAMAEKRIQGLKYIHKSSCHEGLWLLQAKEQETPTGEIHWTTDNAVSLYIVRMFGGEFTIIDLDEPPTMSAYLDPPEMLWGGRRVNYWLHSDGSLFESIKPVTGAPFNDNEFERIDNPQIKLWLYKTIEKSQLVPHDM